MCGILLFHGPDAKQRLPACLDCLTHRGPNAQDIWSSGCTSLGFTRLEITVQGVGGQQPYSHGEFVGAMNGEIYNYHELNEEFNLLGSGKSDAHVMLPLFDILGEQVIDVLDGFYAGVIVQPSTKEAICLRDHIGKKPLFLGRSQNELFITSELKAIQKIDEFEPLPLGCSRVNLETGQVTVLSTHNISIYTGDVSHLLKEAVRKRIPSDNQPIGLFLSGGLDSSLIAAIASQCRDDIIYFTLGNIDSPDRDAVDSLVQFLDLKDIRYVGLPEQADIATLLQTIVYVTESYNPSIISNGLATYLLAQAAHKAGVKVVLTGEGADELFGGYHQFKKDNSSWRKVRKQLINDFPVTELRRLDLCTMAHNIEARCPFLDRALRSFSDQLCFDEMYAVDENKVTLRRNFIGILPDNILNRSKISCDVGSGIRRIVVQQLSGTKETEREQLKAIWKQLFEHDALANYFHSYPIFDALIDQRGESHKC